MSGQKKRGLDMILKNILMVLLIGTSFAITGCTEKSDKLLPVPDFTGLEKEDKQDIGEYVPFNPSVDILFIIDDSGSMQSHQNNLSTNIDLFIAELSNNSVLDWRIGVTTSSWNGTGYGSLTGTPAFVDKNTANFKSILKNNLLVGTWGDPNEVFIETAAGATSSVNLAGPNKSFFRQDALLVIFFITDTEDQGVVTPANAFSSLVSFKNGDPKKLVSYAVLADPNNCEGEGVQPTLIREFLRLTNGKEFSLCDPKFGQNLASIANDILDKIEMVIRLRQRPVVSTITVQFGTQTIPNDPAVGWVYDPIRNVIIISKDLELKPEPKGTQLEVKFIAAILEK